MRGRVDGELAADDVDRGFGGQAGGEIVELGAGGIVGDDVVRPARQRADEDVIAGSVDGDRDGTLVALQGRFVDPGGRELDDPPPVCAVDHVDLAGRVEGDALRRDEGAARAGGAGERAFQGPGRGEDLHAARVVVGEVEAPGRVGGQALRLGVGERERGSKGARRREGAHFGDAFLALRRRAFDLVGVDVLGDRVDRNRGEEVLAAGAEGGVRRRSSGGAELLDEPGLDVEEIAAHLGDVDDLTGLVDRHADRDLGGQVDRRFGGVRLIAGARPRSACRKRQRDGARERNYETRVQPRNRPQHVPASLPRNTRTSAL